MLIFSFRGINEGWNIRCSPPSHRFQTRWTRTGGGGLRLSDVQGANTWERAPAACGRASACGETLTNCITHVFSTGRAPWSTLWHVYWHFGIEHVAYADRLRRWCVANWKCFHVDCVMWGSYHLQTTVSQIELISSHQLLVINVDRVTKTTEWKADSFL